MSDVFPQAELQGPIYCWVAGKAPKTDHWNHKSNLLTLQQIQQGKEDPSWATGYGMVSGRYSGFLCVDVDTKPERPEQPNTTFRNVAKRDLADLPPRPPSSQENQIGGGLTSEFRANGGRTCRATA